MLYMSGADPGIFKVGGGGTHTFQEEKWWHMGAHTQFDALSLQKQGGVPCLCKN